MKVAELIKELQKYDANQEVFLEQRVEIGNYSIRASYVFERETIDVDTGTERKIVVLKHE